MKTRHKECLSPTRVIEQSITLIFPSPNPQRTTIAFDCELHGSLKQSLTHSAPRFPLASTPNTVRSGSSLGVLFYYMIVASKISRTTNTEWHPLRRDSTDGAGCGRPHGWGRFFSLGYSALGQARVTKHSNNPYNDRMSISQIR